MSIDLDALQKLEAAATMGPWVIRSPNVISHGDTTIALCWGTMLKSDGLQELRNAEFLAAFRNAAPELIRLARLGQVAERLVERLRNLDDRPYYVQLMEIRDAILNEYNAAKGEK